jgi:hypothetical protein
MLDSMLKFQSGSSSLRAHLLTVPPNPLSERASQVAPPCHDPVCLRNHTPFALYSPCAALSKVKYSAA